MLARLKRGHTPTQHLMYYNEIKTFAHANCLIIRKCHSRLADPTSGLGAVEVALGYACATAHARAADRTR